MACSSFSQRSNNDFFGRRFLTGVDLRRELRLRAEQFRQSVPGLRQCCSRCVARDVGCAGGHGLLERGATPVEVVAVGLAVGGGGARLRVEPFVVGVVAPSLPVSVSADIVLAASPSSLGLLGHQRCPKAS